jgi:hypothetical protein
VRVHPVNDGLLLNPGVANIPCSVNQTGEALNCVQEITVQEDAKFSISIPNTIYYDPDTAQMPGRNAKYGRAIGISQCLDRYGPIDGSLNVGTTVPPSDNRAFIWSPAMTYQTEYEGNFDSGRVDAYTDVNSQLKAQRRSKGTLFLSGGVPQRGYGQNGSNLPPLAANRSFQRGTSNVATITDLPGVTLTTNCPLDGSNWPTGECSMEVMPSPNITGTYTLCVQLTDAIGPGEFFSSYIGNNNYNMGNLSERIYIKVNIENTPDAPRIAQMPVRGRANEDHEAAFEVGGRNPTVLPVFSEKGGPTGIFTGGGAFGQLVFDDFAATVRPGYFDFDGSKAKFMYIDMTASGATFTGIKGASIRYNADPNLTTYSQVCQAGFPANNICEIPCDAQGWCRYKISPPSDKGTERITMAYWVKTDEAGGSGLDLSSRKAENLVAANGGNTNYAPFEEDKQYLNSNFNCVTTTNWLWDDWRTQFEEDHSVTGIPGLFYQALHPILTPTYSQLSPPSVTRLVPDLLLTSASHPRASLS